MKASHITIARNGVTLEIGTEKECLAALADSRDAVLYRYGFRGQLIPVGLRVNGKVRHAGNVK